MEKHSHIIRESDNQEGQQTINDALTFIYHIKGLISAMGANDVEFSQLDEIERKLKNNKISPKQAIAQAQAVKDSKQDYH